MDRLRKVTERSKTEDLIIVEANEGAIEYKVPRTVLVEASDYFRAALEGEFKETRSKKVKLSVDDAEAVQLLVYYLHQKKLPGFAAEVKEWSATDNDASRKRWEEVLERHKMLANLYRLADSIVIPELQQLALAESAAMMRDALPSLSAFQYGFIRGRGKELGRACVTQAVCEYFQTKRMTDLQLQELAKIDGFLLVFIEKVREALNSASNIEFLPAWRAAL